MDAQFYVFNDEPELYEQMQKLIDLKHQERIMIAHRRNKENAIKARITTICKRSGIDIDPDRKVSVTCKKLKFSFRKKYTYTVKDPEAFTHDEFIFASKYVFDQNKLEEMYPHDNIIRIKTRDEYELVEGFGKNAIHHIQWHHTV